MYADRFIIALIFLCCTSFSYAQSTKITGKVFSSDGTPIQFATIEISDNKHIHNGTITNEKGEFSVSFNDKGIFTLTVRSVGFKSVNKEVSLNANEDINLSFTLSPDLLNIDQVVVTGTRRMLSIQKTPIIVNTIDQKNI